MRVLRHRYLVLLGVFLGAVLLPSCGDDDGGTSTPTSSAPPPPVEFEINETLLADPDVPIEVSGMAGMASGMMMMGQAYMSVAETGGTSAGGGCWEWSWVDQNEGWAIQITGCEESDGSATWEVTITEAGEDPCRVLTGEVAANGLSGNWRFWNCECQEAVLITEWQTNSTGDAWTVDMIMPPTDCYTRLAQYDESDTLIFHYEENADGSGSGFVRDGAEMLWTVTWQVSGSEVTGTFCAYEEGVQIECWDFGTAFARKSPSQTPR